MVHNDGTPRRPCPECGATMDIAWIDLLQLDQCEKHGIWFDPGEFRRALDYDVGQEILRRFRGKPPLP
jgi:Zn-finger nucleic acid-binding protein